MNIIKFSDEPEVGHDIAFHERHIKLSADDWYSFCEELDKPPVIIPQLQKLFEINGIFCD